MLHDPIANMFSILNNSQRSGKKEVIIRNGSKLMGNLLELIKKNNYIDDVLEERTYNDLIFIVKLNILGGNINKCGAIKPRRSVKKNQYIFFEKQYLPAVDVGHLLISTSQGIFSHTDVAGNQGGILIGFIY
ncbi:MAG: 30S ribosomal protein S8 [Candidatus Aenigmarchaeota archaeon ex4484_52]|nr:MAG: 30S ribosomal protein S8 [Candidatus Aenigmarchaeota archaeon ex4484_52]